MAIEIEEYNFNQQKLIWASARAVMEADNQKHKKNGKKSRSHWSSFERILRNSKYFLEFSGIFERGRKNALQLKKKEIRLTFDSLPKAFDGFTILHLSDLHIDSMQELPEAIIQTIGDEIVDVCVVTGDFRFHSTDPYKQILSPLEMLFSHIETRNGIYGVLGNHDTYKMLFHQKELGIRFLVNESVTISYNGDKLIFSGTDDPFKFFSHAAIDALEEHRDGFKIALVHTSELVETANRNGYALYLCGHTHGGQVCLPGGIPIITHQYEGRNFYRGMWQYKGLTGYTSEGCGVSGIPIRFNTRGEVVKITLHSK